MGQVQEIPSVANWKCLRTELVVIRPVSCEYPKRRWHEGSRWATHRLVRTVRCVHDITELCFLPHRHDDDTRRYYTILYDCVWLNPTKHAKTAPSLNPLINQASLCWQKKFSIRFFYSLKFFNLCYTGRSDWSQTETGQLWQLYYMIAKV